MPNNNFVGARFFRRVCDTKKAPLRRSRAFVEFLHFENPTQTNITDTDRGFARAPERESVTTPAPVFDKPPVNL